MSYLGALGGTGRPPSSSLLPVVLPVGILWFVLEVFGLMPGRGSSQHHPQARRGMEEAPPHDLTPNIKPSPNAGFSNCGGFVAYRISVNLQSGCADG